MAITMDTKLKDIMKNPAAVEILEKHFPDFTKNPQLKLGYMMTFRTISKFPQAKQFGLTPEILEQVMAEWAAL